MVSDYGNFRMVVAFIKIFFYALVFVWNFIINILFIDYREFWVQIKCSGGGGVGREEFYLFFIIRYRVKLFQIFCFILVLEFIRNMFVVMQIFLFFFQRGGFGFRELVVCLTFYRWFVLALRVYFFLRCFVFKWESFREVLGSFRSGF